MLLIGIGAAYADVDLPTKFTNRGSIGNTRHNMTQRQASGGGPAGATMDQYRNDYQEICVYCHTPHGANSTTTLPLWNRTMKATTYSTYNQLGTASLTQTVSQPGANSLACLSCHDGQTAVDSIINMPGSGRYDVSQETVQSNAFLNTWTNPRGPNAGSHRGLDASGGSTSCLVCHSPTGALPEGATDFSIFAIGTDLKNDHPVGVTFPATSGVGTDFRTPDLSKGTTRFFDDGDGQMNSNDVRLYDGKVECASCHDPHGVAPGGPGTAFNPSFLRVTNTSSALCLTCHSK